MRTAILLTFLSVLVCIGEDIRVVNSKRIDLDALGTNSPWRTRQIQAINTAGAFPKVTVSIGGEIRTIHLKNIPASITKSFAEAIKMADEVGKLETYVTNEAARLRRLQANIPSEAASDSTGGQAIRAFNNAQVNLEETVERLEKLRRQLHAANTKASESSSERAYFTGQKYGGLEVWDCGVKAAK